MRTVFAGGDLAHDLAVDPADGVELVGPVGGIVRPAQPGGLVRLPLRRHGEAERGGRRIDRLALVHHEAEIVAQPRSRRAWASPGAARMTPAGAAASEAAKRSTMAKTRRYREDLSKTPDWLKKKKLPHRHKFLSGPRILPKGITGKEKLGDLIDSTFLAYNSARLREGCQLFAERMLGAGRHDRHEPLRRADARRPGLLLDRPADQGRLRRLDRRHRREPLPRPALRAQLPRARRAASSSTTPTCATTTSSASTTCCSATATA